MDEWESVLSIYLPLLLSFYIIPLCWLIYTNKPNEDENKKNETCVWNCKKKMAASKFRTPMERKKAIDSREWKFVKLKNRKKNPENSIKQKMMMLIEINKIEKKRLKGTNEPDTHSVRRNAMKYSELRIRLSSKSSKHFFSQAFPSCKRQQHLPSVDRFWYRDNRTIHCDFFSLSLCLPKHILTYTYLVAVLWKYFFFVLFH